LRGSDAVVDAWPHASPEQQPGDEQRDPDADDRRDPDQQRPPLLLEVVDADHGPEVDDDEADDDPREPEQ
jgi:hypothetical protein